MPIETNDNDGVSARPALGPDAHGQAALLLVEALLHGLIARSVLTTQDGVDIVESASDVKLDVAEAWGDSPETMQKSLSLLAAMTQSLRVDIR